MAVSPEEKFKPTILRVIYFYFCAVALHKHTQNVIFAITKKVEGKKKKGVFSYHKILCIYVKLPFCFFYRVLLGVAHSTGGLKKQFAEKIARVAPKSLMVIQL